MLPVQGEIELPSPAYTSAFKPGKSYQGEIPSQHFKLKTEPHDGMLIQLITPMTTERLAATIGRQYRCIIIYCGEQVIATMVNVTAK